MMYKLKLMLHLRKLLLFVLIVLALALLGCSSPKQTHSVTEVFVETNIENNTHAGKLVPLPAQAPPLSAPRPPAPPLPAQPFSAQPFSAQPLLGQPVSVQRLSAQPLAAPPSAPTISGPLVSAPLHPAPPLEEPEPAPSERSFAGDTSGPARQILERAERMHDESVVVRGSCYDYIAAVFDRAGYGARRSREAIFQGPRSGPYADPDLINPGDWLFIIAYPDMRPMGTHSVLFIRWIDREAGQALVISYVGGRADRPANLMTRDVSRTYTIQRARESANN